MKKTSIYFLILISQLRNIKTTPFFPNCSKITISKNGQYLGNSQDTKTAEFSPQKSQSSIFTIIRLATITGKKSQNSKPDFIYSNFAFKNSQGYFLKVPNGKIFPKNVKMDSKDFDFSAIWTIERYFDSWIFKSGKFDLYAEFSNTGLVVDLGEFIKRDSLLFTVECADSFNGNFNEIRNSETVFDFPVLDSLVNTNQFLVPPSTSMASVLESQKKNKIFNQKGDNKFFTKIQNLDRKKKLEMIQIKEEKDPFTCKKITLENSDIDKEFLACEDFSPSKSVFFTKEISEKNIFEINFFKNKYSLKCSNEKFLKPDLSTYYKDIFSKKVTEKDYGIFWEVQKLGETFTFKNDFGGYLKGGREIPNSENPFRGKYSYWFVRCADEL